MQATQECKISLGAYEQKFREKKPDEEPKTSGLIRDIPKTRIEFRNVVFFQPGYLLGQMLDGIDDDSAHGHRGESGSGKTACLK